MYSRKTTAVPVRRTRRALDPNNARRRIWSPLVWGLTTGCSRIEPPSLVFALPSLTFALPTPSPPPPSTTEHPPEVMTIHPSGPRISVLCNRCKLEIQEVGLALPVSRSSEAKDPEFTVVKKKKQKEEVPRRTSERLAQRARKTWVDAKPQRVSKKRKSKEMN